MKQLKDLKCPIVAMSATLTDVQINTLKQQYLRNGSCVVLTSGVHRDNVQISMQRYNGRNSNHLMKVMMMMTTMSMRRMKTKFL